MSELAGRVAIITGGAQGIGLGIARALANAGASVVVADVQGEKALSAAQQLANEGTQAASAACDVAVSQDVNALIELTLSHFGSVDILVNNAGGSGHNTIATIEETEAETWNAVVGANLTGTYLCTKAVVPLMKPNRFGRIINVSSGAARGSSGSVGTVGARLPYVAAKAAIEGITRQLAHDLAAFGITCNCIVPGLVMTEPGARLYERFAMLDSETKAIWTRMMHNDFATPADLGELARYLCSNAARHVNGQMIPIGMTG